MAKKKSKKKTPGTATANLGIPVTYTFSFNAAPPTPRARLTQSLERLGASLNAIHQDVFKVRFEDQRHTNGLALKSIQADLAAAIAEVTSAASAAADAL
jgi:hypothetical protein